MNQQLEDQKNRVKSLEFNVQRAKSTYKEALENLEYISNEIHRVCLMCFAIDLSQVHVILSGGEKYILATEISVHEQTLT